MNIDSQKIYTGIVSGKELQDVSKAIFGSASTFTTKEANSATKKIDYTKFSRIDAGIDLFEGSTSIQQTQNIAKAKAGMGVELTSSAAESLKYLKSAAAQLSAANAYNRAQGQIGIPAKFFELKAVSSDSAKSAQNLTTKEMGSDKEGSNPFHYIATTKSEKKDSDENTNLSLFL